MTTIPLSKGKLAIVDDADYAELSKYKWHAACGRWGLFYAATKIRRKTVLMHVLLLGKQAGMVTDHINGDGLDNRRTNLRMATPSQNNANRRSVGTSLGLRGVRQQRGRFEARIQYQCKGIFLGAFDTAGQAAQAYDVAALEIYGAFARLNFPERATAEGRSQ